MFVLFPRYWSDTTCFFNPYLENFCVTLNSKNYPNNNTSTVSVDFFKLQRDAALLGGMFACSESFENSQNIVPTVKYPIHDRTFGDNSEFVSILPLERLSSNCFFFDGVNLENEAVRIQGRFLQQTLNNIITPVNCYHVLNRHNHEPGFPDPENPAVQANEVPQYNVTPPILITCHDTFWIFSVGKRAEYIVDETFNECFQKRFPELYAQLVKTLRT
jgi:hypothetical protein